MSTASKRWASGTLLAALCLACGDAHVEDKRDAQAAAEAWLALVDGGHLDESWEQAADLFRHALAREVWSATAVAARRPFGNFVSRSVRQVTYTETVPSAPDGQYVIIVYDSVFALKREAIETVTPMFEDGEWKVSGYYIR